MMPKVLLVVQPSLSHYREPFVKALLDSGEVEFLLAGRFPKRSSQSKKVDTVGAASEDLRNLSKQLVRKNLFGHFFWDKGLLSLVYRHKFELVVLEGNFYNISTWVSAILLRLLNRRVAFWGHGWKRSEEGLKLKLRLLFYHLPQGHFVYGDAAAGYAESHGFHRKNWHVIYNSLYPSAQLGENTAGAVTEPGKLSLVFSGRLTKRHGVDLLVQAVIRLRSEENLPIQLNIVGNGTEFESLVSLANEDKEAFNFLGVQHDYAVLRDIYAKSQFAVSPGASGLNVIQALGFGVPVIAAADNPESGPEIEAIKEGETGLLFEHSNIQSLMNKLRYAYEMPLEERRLMAMAGKEIVGNRYNAESHAAAMLRGIKKILNC